ncbi:ABC transporter permease [Billgrantia tianxiuensis]|jgi:Cu-processing system permease protein|uniref:ABC transporter permease n=1 Tax=Billgrantia tianxiuensis TaxID=2497861 RepID=A0A6I6SKF0_9GAMM|nr:MULTISPECIES: ABC transporter permease [Halomonas]MCE8035069.1 ABC transporter permease [Halomonas sp. MCCC 1A11057]QHC48430.1 ABC transporter permease [Halomonas tianxiuensis]
MNTALIVARKEFQDGLRNRWVLAIALILAALAVGIAWFGAAASGGMGFTSLATTVVSLSTLAVFLIPLIALLLAYDAVVGEQEAGTLLLLLTYPLSRTSLLLGKFLGHGLILGAATALGFGIAGTVIALAAEGVVLGELVASLGLLILSSVLLGWVFIAFAYLISVWVSEKARAAGLALGVWFLFVLVFDLGLLALLVSVQSGGDWLPWLLLLNPTDGFRLINMVGFDSSQAYTGVTAIAQGSAFHVGWLLLILVGWIVAPLGLAVLRFRRHSL